VVGGRAELGGGGGSPGGPTTAQLQAAFRMLVEAGADPHAPNARHHSPLELALRWYGSGLALCVHRAAAVVAQGKAALQALIVGAAAEVRRQQRQAGEVGERLQQLQLREETCEQRERELNLRQLLA